MITNEPVKVTSGSYTGNDTADRAIAHGLGRIPKLVYVTETAADFNFFCIANSIGYILAGGGGGGAVTAPDATNFHVGTAGLFVATANNTGKTYNWVCT